MGEHCSVNGNRLAAVGAVKIKGDQIGRKMWPCIEAFAVGDVVLDRSCGGGHNDASLGLSSISTRAVLAVSEVRPLSRRLEKLEGSCAGERCRLHHLRQLLNRHMGGPSSGGGRVVGLPHGIVAALAKIDEGSCGKDRLDLSATTELLCGILAYLPFKSRAALRIASEEIHGQFKGAQQIVSIRVARTPSGARDERPRNSTSSPVHFVEVRALRYNPPSHVAAPTFVVSKQSIKVYSLKPGDEVFFRPAMTCLGGYDQSQDWPRGRIMDWRQDRRDCCSGLARQWAGAALHNSSNSHPAIRPDGFVIFQTWSWRLSSGAGATIIARWNDVRRARPRAKYQVSGIARSPDSVCEAPRYHLPITLVSCEVSSMIVSHFAVHLCHCLRTLSYQMLPEQRVWMAQELKEQAKVVFEEAVGDEKAEKEWRDYSKQKSEGTSGKSAGGFVGAINKLVGVPNSAFIFLKPNITVTACGNQSNTKVAELVRARLSEAGVTVREEGLISGEAIRKHGLIDRHYGTIAAKALAASPRHLEVTLEQRSAFQQAFGLSWYDALRAKQLVNAKEASEEIADILRQRGETNRERMVSEDEDIKASTHLSDIWDGCIRKLDTVKLGGGFHVGKVLLPQVRAVETIGTTDGTEESRQKKEEGSHQDHNDSLRGIDSRVRYVINGFYMHMREPYLASSAVVHYFVAEWPPPDCLPSAKSMLSLASPLSWLAFREDVLGATDPAEAKVGSLRRSLHDDWERLGLSAQPGLGTNGIHASAGPFEALVEKMNWVGTIHSKKKSEIMVSVMDDVNAPTSLSNSARAPFSIDGDCFGSFLLGGTLSKETLTAWSEDPIVAFEGSRVSLFDLLQAIDAPECVLKARAIASDAYGKLNAAKGRYLEAVSMVEGDHIYDPDGTSRRTSEQKAPCSTVQAGIAEMKVTCYTAIALCCKKLTHVIDNSPAVQAFKQQQQQRHGKIKGQTRNYLGQDKTILGQALQVRRELLVDMIAYGFKAASVIEDLESITPNPSKPIRNNKRVEIIKEIERTRKHSFTKWFCLMRSKALFIAAGALLDSSCPNRYRKVDESYEARDAGSNGAIARGFISLDNPVLTAIGTLKSIRHLHEKYAPSKSAASQDDTFSRTSTSAEDACSAVPATLRKQLDTQIRETERLFAIALAQRKKQNKKGTKLWKAAFDKNAKQTPAEPIKGLGDSSKHNEDMTTAAGALQTNGGTQQAHSLISRGVVKTSERFGEKSLLQRPDSTLQHSTMLPLDGRAEKKEKMDGHGAKDSNENEDELNDIHEALLGAAALVGVAAAIGIGAMYLAKRLR